MGRSRGGLTTKIHALVDAEGRPVRLELTPGQAHDGAMAAVFLPDIKPGATLLADRAYDSDAIRANAKARTQTMASAGDTPKPTRLPRMARTRSNA